jgi:hypothetical protein
VYVCVCACVLRVCVCVCESAGVLEVLLQEWPP